jgi:hypothetical protein
MPDNDLPIGRLLSRREALAALGATGVSLLAGCSPSPRRAAGAASTGGSMEIRDAGLSCIVRPEQTEGPYFVDGMLNRGRLPPRLTGVRIT